MRSGLELRNRCRKAALSQPEEPPPTITTDLISRFSASTISSLFAARDHHGLKPLPTVRRRRSVVVSSSWSRRIVLFKRPVASRSLAMCGDGRVERR
jgi:hypothetical protein